MTSQSPALSRTIIPVSAGNYSMLPESYLANVRVCEASIVLRLLDRHDGYSYFCFSAAELYRTRQDVQYHVCILSLQVRTRYRFRFMTFARANHKDKTWLECGTSVRALLDGDKVTGFCNSNILRSFNRLPHLDQERYRIGLDNMYITDPVLILRYQRLSSTGLKTLLSHYLAFYASDGTGTTVVRGDTMLGERIRFTIPFSRGWLCRTSRRVLWEHLARIIVTVFIQSRRRVLKRKPRKQVKMAPLVQHLTEDNLALLIADYALEYFRE